MTRIAFPLSLAFLGNLSATRTSAQVQINALQTSFIQHALDGANLFSMSAGSLSFRLARIGLSSLNPIFASALALGGEVAVYRGVHQIFSAHQEQGSSFKNFLRDYIHFACLKGFAFLAPGQSLWGQGIQTAGMVLTESLLTHLQFLPEQNLGLVESFVQAFSINLALNAGTGLSSIFFGVACHRFERSLNYNSVLSAHLDEGRSREVLPRFFSQKKEGNNTSNIPSESGPARHNLLEADLKMSALLRAFSLEAGDRVWLRNQDKAALQRDLIEFLLSDNSGHREHLDHFFREAELMGVQGKDQKLRLLSLLFQPSGQLVLDTQTAYQVLNRLAGFSLPRELGLFYHEALLQSGQRRLVLGGEESVASPILGDIVETHLHPHRNNLAHVFPSAQDIKVLWHYRNKTEFEGRERVQWVLHARGASCYVRTGREFDLYWALRGTEAKSRINAAVKLNETLYAPLGAPIRLHRVEWNELESHWGDPEHWLTRPSQ